VNKESIENYNSILLNYYDSSQRPYTKISHAVINNIVTSSEISLTRPTDIDELVQAERAFLTGPAGSGKTSVLDTIAHRVLKQKAGTPVFIPLHAFTTTIEELINLQIKRFSDELNFQIVMEGDSLLYLLFDGYDDILKPLRTEFDHQLKDFLSAHTIQRIIITSRFRPSEIYSSWREYEIKELNDADIRSILAPVTSSDDIDQIYSKPDLLALARKPLFLATIASGIENNVNIGEYTARQIPTYTKWRGHTRSQLPASISSENLENAMEYLAFDLVKNNANWVESQAAGDILIASGINNDVAIETFNALKATDPIRVDEETVGFRHKSYQIAYTAKYLLDKFRAGQDIIIPVKEILKSDDSRSVFEDLYVELSAEEGNQFLTNLDEETRQALIGLIPDHIASLYALKEQDISGKAPVTEALIRTKKSLERFDRRKRDIVVFSIHGFNTRGNWKNELTPLLAKESDGERFIPHPWDYGSFKFGIINPISRRAKIKEFQEFYNKHDYEDAEICAVAHSFGTYILGNALKRFQEVRFDRIILIGSVLPTNYPWSTLATKVKHVVNEVGGNDWALRIVRYVKGLGTSGKDGFQDSPEFVTQVFNEYGGHSDSFGSQHMKKSWIPFLRTGHINFPGASKVED
jgi:hypothetical protein